MTGVPVSCVTYVSAADDDRTAGQELLADYAHQQDLTVVATYADHNGAGPPEDRSELQLALAAIREGRAEVLLTVSSAMISPVGSEYSAVLGEVREANGQLVCVGWSRSKQRVLPPTAPSPAVTVKPSPEPNVRSSKSTPLLKRRVTYVVGAVVPLGIVAVWAVMATAAPDTTPSSYSSVPAPFSSELSSLPTFWPEPDPPTASTSASPSARSKPTSKPKATPKPSPRPSTKAASKKRVAETVEAPQVTVRGRANQMPFLEVAGAETNDGARVTTHAWTDDVLGRNQWWIMHRLADGNIALESAVAPGKVLTLNQEHQGAVWPANPGASSQGTAALEQEDLPDSQRWKLVSTGDGWSQLVSAINGQWCLYDRVTLNEPVMINTCDAAKVWQQWVIGEGPSSPVPSIP